MTSSNEDICNRLTAIEAGLKTALSESAQLLELLSVLTEIQKASQNSPNTFQNMQKENDDLKAELKMLREQQAK
jgi:hypothetical protein